MDAKSKLAQRLRGFIADQSGAVSVEYGLIMALIVIAMLGAVSEFADTSVGIFSDVASQAASNM